MPDYKPNSHHMPSLEEVMVHARDEINLRPTASAAAANHREPEQVVGLPRDKLSELLDLLQKPMIVPTIGVDAASAMEQCYEAVAKEIDGLAQEHVNRALALQQEIQTFAVIIRESGKTLCARIEQEAARGYQIASVVKAARSAVDGGE